MTLWQIWICLYPMPHCGCVCSNSTLIMVPINFWRNSDLFKKKNIFQAQKLAKLEHFKGNLSNFPRKISQIQNINLLNVFGVTVMILSIRLTDFGSIWLWNYVFGSKCNIPMFQSPVCPPPPAVWGLIKNLETLFYYLSLISAAFKGFSNFLKHFWSPILCVTLQ